MSTHPFESSELVISEARSNAGHFFAAMFGGEQGELPLPPSDTDLPLELTRALFESIV